MASLDWGTVPTWVGTLFTSASVTLAAISYLRSVLDRERDQAASVSAWLSAPEQTGPVTYRKGKDGKLRIVAPLPVVGHVANRSDNPVFDIDLKVQNHTWTLHELPSGCTAEVSIPVEFSDYVPDAA